MGTSEEYRIQYYVDHKGKTLVEDYINKLSKKEQLKFFSYLEILKDSQGYLDEPYSKHIKGKIRELRVDFSKNHHRIFYFTFINKKIILLHAFLKKTKKTPNQEIKKAINNYQDFLINQNKYD
ncbi:type II toxin-antitoxin system RelE/ParE family toxin [Patescibacteria group bacterium]|nr:type II toxin-antitoxin system RelE/ParE family toxin [Patescibacteria group bacterium]